MSRRWALIGAAALLALAAFAAGLLAFRSGPPPWEDAGLPPRAAVQKLLATPLLDTAGQAASLARWRGKPLIVNFWATWCPPCLAEMPVFSTLQQRHPEVQFVGIAIDTADNVRSFAAARRLSYPLLVGTADTVSLLADLGNVRNGLPFTLAVDADGQARRVHLGGLSEPEAEKLVAGLR